MHAFSIVTIGIFVAGYSTARWDLVTRLYELGIFAWDHGVVARAAKGFALLSVLFLALVLPIARIAARETDLVSSEPRNSAYTRLNRRSTHGLQVPVSLPVSSSNVAAHFSGGCRMMIWWDIMG
jgi:hypothetical protein